MGYVFHLSPFREPDPLVEFIRRHWKPGHVFARVPALLSWQHWNRSTQSMNFAAALESASGEPHAILGYIPLSHFDQRLSSKEGFLAIWRTAQTVPAPGLGVSLLKFYIANAEPVFLGAIGLAQQVIPIYRQVLRFEVGKLDHHVLINHAIKDPGILKWPQGHESGPPRLSRKLRMAPLTESELLSLDEDDVKRLFRRYAPRKSPAYMLKRYLKHPWYHYEVQGLLSSERLEGIIVFRTVEALGKGRALRIVDFFGDEQTLAGASGAIYDRMESLGVEYVDVLSHGMGGAALRAAGFADRAAVPGLVVPNHFEPFEQQNADLDYAYMNKTGLPVRLFKGDSDQDRPNLLEENTSC